MNPEWSEKNKTMQALLKKSTFPAAVDALLALREVLMQEALLWRSRPVEELCAMPFPHAEGYHSKTVAYSLWHIFRIEDIVVQSLIRRKAEILFSSGFRERMGASIITTGNELCGEQIAAFSRQLDIGALYDYAMAVRAATDSWLRELRYEDLKTGFTEDDRARLRSLGVVSGEESACWLIDYWCGKDIRGLLRMPLSRHWIMHIEAAGRILDGIDRRK